MRGSLVGRRTSGEYGGADLDSVIMKVSDSELSECLSTMGGEGQECASLGLYPSQVCPATQANESEGWKLTTQNILMTMTRIENDADDNTPEKILVEFINDLTKSTSQSLCCSSASLARIWMFTALSAE